MEKSYCRQPEVLLIDDEPQQIHLVASILQEKMFKVKVLVNANEVFAFLEEKIPDLILLDIMMPEINGIELCKQIKADTRFASIPIIFLTAISDSETIINAFSAGGQDYVSKPVNERELLARVEVHLELKCKAEKLEEAYREIESFNYMVCHDLKSPLFAIKSLVRFLNDEFHTCSEEDARRFLSGLNEKATESIQLIEKLSELSKVSSEPLSKENINMKELFVDLLVTLVEENKDRDINYSISTLPQVSGDRILLKQVVYNILSNAFKYTSPRKYSIVDIEYIENNEEHVFCVSDNGVGFNMTYSNRLFNMFHRLHTKKDFEGTGTGLAIAKKIVTRHGGKIWIESELDKGTKVFFSLPLR